MPGNRLFAGLKIILTSCGEMFVKKTGPCRAPGFVILQGGNIFYSITQKRKFIFKTGIRPHGRLRQIMRGQKMVSSLILP